MIKLYDKLTVNGESGSVAGPLPRDVGGDAAVVARVGQAGLQHQQVTRRAHDKVGVRVRLDGHAVLEPGHDPWGGVAAGRVATQLGLVPHLDVRRVGRSLEIFP